MFRDFSDSAKQKLLDYVAEVTANTTWEKVTDAIGDLGLHVKSWFGFLNISAYVNNLGSYHKQVIDKNNTTKAQIERIFTQVKAVDARYQNGLTSEVATSNAIVQLINDLATTIDPSGGNLDMSKMSATLKADVEAIQNSQATTQKTLEDEMLGTDPEGASTSIDPVNLSTGNYIYEHRDMEIRGEIPLIFHRYYNSKDARISALGKSFRHNYEISLKQEEDGEIDITMEDGQHRHFLLEDDAYTGKNTINELLVKKEEGFWFYRSDGDVLKFDENNRLFRMEDQNQRGIDFIYDEKKRLCEAKNDNGDALFYEYDDESGFINCVKDHTGRHVDFSYEEKTMESVTLVNNKTVHYKYGINGRITEVASEKKGFSVRNEYDNKFRVVKQMFPDGGSMSFLYDDENKTVTQIERNGARTVYVHDDAYRNVEKRYEDGTKEKYVYNDKNQCIKYTDRMNNILRMSYDNRGNVVQRIDALKRRYNMTYDAANHLLSLSINGKKRVKNYYDKNGNLLRKENFYGEAIDSTYDANGRLIENKYPDGGKVRVLYDEKGNVRSLTNRFGGTIQYFYNDLHQIIRVLDARGNESLFEYNEAGNIVKETNAEGKYRCYQYNDENLLVGITDYNGEETKRTYNCLNLLEKFVDQNGFETRVKYDSMWNISEIVRPNGSVRKYLYDKENRMDKIIDGLGNISEIRYNVNGDCISEIESDKKTEYAYDTMGRLIMEKDAIGSVYEYEYDNNDNLTLQKDPLGNTVKMEYDEEDRMVSQIGSLGETRRYTYTPMGEIESVTDENGLITRFTYVPGGREIKSVTYPNGQKEELYYDKNGNIEKIEAKSGAIYTYTYDKLNRMTSDAINGKIQAEYAYDAVGNMISTTSGDGFVTKYIYSAKGEMIKSIDAEGNESEYTYNENSELVGMSLKDHMNVSMIQTHIYERDLEGRVTAIKDPAGNVERFEYDVHGLLKRKEDKDGYQTHYAYTPEGDLSYIRYADGQEVKMSYDALRHLQEVQDWTGITKIENDAVGRALSVTYPSNEKVLYEYNVSGKKTGLIYPDGEKAFYTYDALQRLASIKNKNAMVRYEYDERGNLQRKCYSKDLETTYEYNESGLISSLKNLSKGEVIDSYKYKYDSVGRKQFVEKSRLNAEEDSGRYQYAYDPLGRLEAVLKDDKQIRNYKYDGFGNRIGMVDERQEISYSYNELNQLIHRKQADKDEKYTYDQRGNLVAVYENDIQKHAYTFDATNRLREATTAGGSSANYVYNGLGHRVEKTIHQNAIEPDQKLQYVLDMSRLYNNLLEEKTNYNSQKYIWDEGVVGIYNNRSCDMNFYLQDELGSVIREVGTDGSLVETYGYDEFGGDLFECNHAGSLFGFTGYQRDRIAGTYYAQAREYMPSTGRFLSKDLVKGNQADRQSLNDYLYCKDDPKNYVDLNGLFVLTAIVAAAVIGAVAGAAIEAGKQGIEIAQGKRKKEDFKIGKVIGAAVEGAIVGGVSATGVGLIGTMVAGGVGAAANSTISQGVDDGVDKVNWGKVAEDTVVGAATSGIFYGVGQGVKALKSKLGIESSQTKSLLKTNDKAVAKQNAKMEAAIAATGRTSPHRQKQLAQLMTEQSGLVKQFTKEELKKKIKQAIIKSSLKVVSLEDGKGFVKQALRALSPIYYDDPNLIEYFEDYFGSLYGKIIGKCPLYA